MPIATVFYSACDGEACDAQDERVHVPVKNQTTPVARVQPGWTQDKDGKVYCPECTLKRQAADG